MREDTKAALRPHDVWHPGDYIYEGSRVNMLVKIERKQEANTWMAVALKDAGIRIKDMTQGAQIPETVRTTEIAVEVTLETDKKLINWQEGSEQLILGARCMKTQPKKVVIDHGTKVINRERESKKRAYTC